MRRQLLATTAAVTTMVAIGFVTPAFAQVELEQTEDPVRFDGETVCEDLLLDDLQLVFLDGVEFGDPLPTAITPDEFEEEFGSDLPAVAVIVQGDPDANVYLYPPTQDLVAPDGEGIVFIDVCTIDEEEPPPPDEPTKPTTDKPTEPTESPAPVPTEVPAGRNAGGTDAGGPWALIAAACAAVAGTAVFARRRFLHDS
jgi:hypothetical protein